MMTSMHVVRDVVQSKKRPICDTLLLGTKVAFEQIIPVSNNATS